MHCLQLVDSALTGYIILRPQNAEEPFNRGLPSWNGSAPNLSEFNMPVNEQIDNPAKV